jgi:glucose-6-phosphate-specific signal transduction histidine kinase
MTHITPAQVLTELSHHIGKDNGIHVRDLVARITGQLLANELMERRVRQIVTEMRMEGHHICAHPAQGYFMAANPEELNDTCEFLYERAMTSLSQVSRMKQVSLPDLRGQLHLPT